MKHATVPFLLGTACPPGWRGVHRSEVADVNCDTPSESLVLWAEGRRQRRTSVTRSGAVGLTGPGHKRAGTLEGAHP